MFSIDFDKLISDLLPWFHRKTTMLAWLRALISPITTVYAGFLTFRDDKLYESHYNGQVAELEYVLNDHYYSDGTLQRIYIDDNTNQGDTFIYNTAELEDDTFIFNTDETGAGITDTFINNVDEGSGQVDFIVMVPDTLTYDADYLITLVTKYKQAGPSFSIETYTES